MAVADTLQELATDLTNAYTTLENKGADIPTNKNTNNLMSTIQSLNVGNITSEVVKKTLTAEATSISFSITSGQAPKAIELWSANEGTTMQSGEIRKAFFINQAGAIYRNNRVNGQNAWSPCATSGDNVAAARVTLTDTSVTINHTSNTYYLADVEYKLIAYYWEDSQKLPTLTATSDMTTSQGVYNFLKQYAENDAYTIFTREDGEDFRTLSDDSFGIFVILKTNNTPSGISAVTWKNNVLRIIPYPESSAYALKLNEGEKVYRTVIPLDGKVYKDDSELVSLIEGTITEIENDNVTKINTDGMRSLTSLESASFPNATDVGQFAFRESNLKICKLPKLETASNQVFLSCRQLLTCDFGVVATIYNSTFQNCSSFKNLLLRKQNSITILSNVGAFQSTPFRDGTGGTVYVPSALVSTYESATNWSSLESTTFAAIEDNIATLEALGLNVDEFKE